MPDKEFNIKFGTPGSGQIDDSKNKIRGLTSAINALTSVMSGQMSVANGLMHASRGLYDIIGKGVAWIGIAAAVARATQAVAEYTAKIMYAGEATAESGKAVRDFRHELERLEETKLENLKKEIESLGAGLDDLQKQWDRDRAREKTVGQSKAEAEMAGIEAEMPEGPAKQEALANARAKYESETLKAEEDAAKDKITAANAQKKEAQAKLNELKEAVKKAPGGTREEMVAEEQLKAARPAIEKKIAQAEQARLDQEAALESIKYRREASTSKHRGTVTTAQEEARAAQIEEARKGEKKFAEQSIGSQEEELELAEGSLPTYLRRASAAQRAAGAARAAATPHKGRLGGGVTTAQKSAVSEAGAAEKQAAQDLAEMVAYIKSLAGSIKNAKDQIKNSSRD